MRYRLRYSIETETERDKGRITEKEGWSSFSARTLIVELPDSLAGDRLYDALEQHAAEQGITRIFDLACYLKRALIERETGRG